LKGKEGIKGRLPPPIGNSRSGSGGWEKRGKGKEGSWGGEF